MDTLREVKSYMEWWGWSNGGSPGSVKRDVDDKVVAQHGDAVWIADVDKACDTIKRIADRATEKS